jgi:hypothetical protein
MGDNHSSGCRLQAKPEKGIGPLDVVSNVAASQAASPTIRKQKAAKSHVINLQANSSMTSLATPTSAGQPNPAAGVTPTSPALGLGGGQRNQEVVGDLREQGASGERHMQSAYPGGPVRGARNPRQLQVGPSQRWRGHCRGGR